MESEKLKEKEVMDGQLSKEKELIDGVEGIDQTRCNWIDVGINSGNLDAYKAEREREHNSVKEHMKKLEVIQSREIREKERPKSEKLKKAKEWKFMDWKPWEWNDVVISSENWDAFGAELERHNSYMARLRESDGFNLEIVMVEEPPPGRSP